jgi:predicted MPP superfamily phosphohydrolase
MFFTTQPTSAADAHNNGFVNAIIPVSELVAYTYKQAGHIARNARCRFVRLKRNSGSSNKPVPLSSTHGNLRQTKTFFLPPFFATLPTMILFGLLLLLCSLTTAFFAGKHSAAAFFPNHRLLRFAWVALALCVSLSFFIGFLFRGTPTLATTALHISGSAWIITLPYWILALAAFEIVRRVQRRRPFLPAFITRRPLAAKRAACLAVPTLIGAVLLYGYTRFDNPEITPVEVHFQKSAGTRKALRVAIASDLHLGEITGKARLAQNVARINALNPDLILLAGDLVDSRPAVLTEQNMREELSRLRASLGVYAVLGNHDNFAGQDDECAAYFTQSGVRVLRDEVLPLDGGAFYLVGRRDKIEKTFKDRGKTVAEILQGISPQKPVLILDHQPQNSRVREGADWGADLYVSGHTHGGQVWPITWVVPFLYKVSYGLGREGQMAVYVTSGLGLWGFPARIGSKSEIVDMKIVFP